MKVFTRHFVPGCDEIIAVKNAAPERFLAQRDHEQMTERTFHYQVFTHTGDVIARQKQHRPNVP